MFGDHGFFAWCEGKCALPADLVLGNLELGFRVFGASRV